MKKTISQEYLKSRLHYESDTGLWTWLRKIELTQWDESWNTRWAGKQAGAVVLGYIEIGIDGENYKAHRLAWIYMTDEQPPEFIDHENYDRGDCRWLNLREASKSQNMYNMEKTKKNSSGYKGVTFDKQTGMWRALITANGVQHCLGRHKNILAAHEAYKKAALKYHGEFARIGQ